MPPIKPADQSHYRFNHRAKPRVFPQDAPLTGSGSGSGGTTTTSGGCLCSSTCIDDPSITGCSAANPAAKNYRFRLNDAVLVAALGVTSIVFSHDADCGWVSPTFEGVDIGHGAHDITFRMEIASRSAGGLVITMEDET